MELVANLFSQNVVGAYQLELILFRALILIRMS